MGSSTIANRKLNYKQQSRLGLLTKGGRANVFSPFLLSGSKEYIFKKGRAYYTDFIRSSA